MVNEPEENSGGGSGGGPGESGGSDSDSYKSSKAKLSFASGSSVLSSSMKKKLRAMVRKSGKSADYTITGTATRVSGVPALYVKNLAKKRAQKVRAYLVSRGVKKSHIEIKARMLTPGKLPKTKVVAKS